MSFEIARARSRANDARFEMQIKDTGWVKTSFPDFYEKWQKVL